MAVSISETSLQSNGVNEPPPEVLDRSEAPAATSQSQSSKSNLPKNRTSFRVVIVAIIIVVAVVIVLNRVAPKFFVQIGDFAKSQRHDKWSPARLLPLLALTLLIDIIPLPVFPMTWQYMMSFIYGYPGFPILFASQSLGGLLAFLFARYGKQTIIFSKRSADNSTDSKYCPCCSRQGWTCIFAEATVKVVEERPLRMIFMVSLGTHVPSRLSCWVLGAEASFLRWWTFWLPWTCGGIKLIFPIVITSQVEDVFKIIDGSNRDPVLIAFTFITVFLAVVFLVLVTRMAWQQVRRAQAELQEHASG